MNLLLEKINQLDETIKNIFERIFEVKVEKAFQNLPPNLKEIYPQAESQDILIIKNKITQEETHFNIWRSKRKEPQKKISTLKEEYDPFCDPLKNTPTDDLGRLENIYAITSSNLTKINKDHSLIIFKEHNKEKITAKEIEGALNLAWEWFEKKSAKLKLIFWNNGLRAGSSIIHPHLQIIIPENIPAKINDFFIKIENYYQIYKSNYLEDLFLILGKLELARQIKNFKIFIPLTPFKDRQVCFYADSLKNNQELITLLLFKYSQMVQNFNLLIFEGEKGLWGFLVDRGSDEKLNSDIGALEIFAFSVVGFDLIEFSQELFRNW